MIDAAALGQMLADAITPMLDAALAEIVESHAAALAEFTAAVAQALKPRQPCATIATDCDDLAAEVRREIEPGGARRAYD